MELEDLSEYNEAAEFEAWAAAVDQQIYESQVIEPRCNICSATGRGPQRDLECMGWTLNAAGEYCPSH